MEGIRYRFSSLYQRFTESPEHTRFRRYTGLWTWMLYNQNAKIQKLQDECNAIIKSIQGFGNGETVFTVTDLHVAHMPVEHSYLNEKIETLRKETRRYLKDLCLGRTVAQLPDPSNVFSKHFAGTPNLCEGGLFGPTGESDEYYKHPPHPDTCTLKEMERQDPVTGYIINNIEATAERLRKTKDNVETPIPESKGIDLNTIRTVMNILTSVYAPLMFTATIAILDCIDSSAIRITVAGVLGALLALSVQLTVENVKRGEIFAITAAYFAIAGIFIGASNSNGR